VFCIPYLFVHFSIVRYFYHSIFIEPVGR